MKLYSWKVSLTPQVKFIDGIYLSNYMTLYEKYIGLHGDFPLRLSALPKQAADKILKRLQQEKKDKLNFLSTISEYRFGEFLHNSAFKVFYDNTIENKTPDWLFEYNGVRGVCEVKKVNPIEKELIIEEIHCFIHDCTKHIKVGVVVWLNSEKVNGTEFNTYDNFATQLTIKVKEIEQFLLDNNSMNLTIVLLNEAGKGCYKLKFKKDRKKTTLNKISWIESFDSIRYDIRRTYGSEIIQKIEKYKPLIESQQLKFYIGLDINFDTAITPDEIFSSYVGAGYLDIDINVKGTYLGKFYTEDAYKCLDGILVRYNGGFYFIANPRKLHALNDYFKTITLPIPDR